MADPVKPSQSEEDYFAREEVLKKKKLAAEVHARYGSSEREKLKQIHHMHCPQCGMELQKVTFKGIFIDKCFDCGAVSLSEADLKKLTGDEGDIIDSILELFR